ncbi:iron export ABC transporter permease subunit FetB [Oceanidesulfovibrio indonesiensis]|uniref:Iron export ABC transporter permease subunit FetB n=1 Tax=Oceanidesulfovibrio indonesiensis TaxID=54767 RepID=A0A7M3MDH0_9BACT|nr:iron export ABC transporter permease subunit FetB [Oceanidesulfovibrio indonesiensis]TVM16258.1 iron export ABC transporter permease subunit FetB [Oceanidesulfovibrio indonesiensis]
MVGEIIEIGPLQLVVGLLFILVAQGASLAWRLGLGRDLLVGTARTFAQLLLMGYVLRFIFELDLAWVTIGVFCIMSAAAAQVASGRVKERRIPFLLPLSVTMFLSFFLVSYVVTAVVVGAEPWWRPQYFIPLAGMVVGNSMTAVAIALDRLLSELSSRRNEVEMLLSLGASPDEASRDMVRQAMRAGMIPAINSMMAVGLVFIPGMMTGQIIAGADPANAVRYQIVVMLMITASCALGSLGVVLWVRRRCFGRFGELLLAHGRSS